MHRILPLIAIAGSMLFCLPCPALDHITFLKDGRQQHISGKVEIDAADGGVLLLTGEGGMYALQPNEILKRSQDDVPFAPLDADALGKQLLTTLPEGFHVHSTANYLICYDTSKAYAEWCGALFERLYRGFTNYWSRKGFELHEPQFPLVAIVFADRAAYLKYAQAELGASAEGIVAYYNLQNNRIVMYDLTGTESLRQPGARSTAAQINRLLSRPEAESNVATIVHEATHQIAFNSGLQTRFADIPLWVSEGLAVFFETPDLQSAKGWRNIGAVNRSRLDQFRRYLPTRGSESLKSLLADDQRFRNPRFAADAYAEAWALNYYLLNKKPKEYLVYLKVLAAKPSLAADTPEQRLEEFQSHFGKDLATLDADLLRTIQKVK